MPWCGDRKSEVKGVDVVQTCALPISFEEEFRRGLLALSGDDLTQARQSLENASRAKPDNAMVWAALAQTYLRVHEIGPANEAAGRAARLAPADSPVQHALAMFYSETGDFSKAANAERQYRSEEHTSEL